MVDAVSATSALHRILLTWDYFELGERVAMGGGAFETLKPVPPTFENIKASLMHGSLIRASFQAGGVLPSCQHAFSVK